MMLRMGDEGTALEIEAAPFLLDGIFAVKAKDRPRSSPSKRQAKTIYAGSRRER